MCVWSVELANRTGCWGIWTLFILQPFICQLEMNNQESVCMWGIFAKWVLSGWVWRRSHLKQSHFLLNRFWINRESSAPQIVWSLLHCLLLQILTSGRCIRTTRSVFLFHVHCGSPLKIVIQNGLPEACRSSCRVLIQVSAHSSPSLSRPETGQCTSSVFIRNSPSSWLCKLTFMLSSS